MDLMGKNKNKKEKQLKFVSMVLKTVSLTGISEVHDKQPTDLSRKL